MNLTATNLENCFEQAKLLGVPYVAVKIEMAGFPEPEIIINKRENIDSKLAYYKKTYDGDLTHKFAPGIKIVSFTFGDDFGDIQEDLD
ncbi:hypothetical protein [Niallia sp. NCCP-28]|uniref:hypothetical protein n=1 Tax=Niallia sp. NCCP-28 TaxID=2934712 RepID=UPI00207FDDEB|nr:hypothetical protein [Niallia sp. NCCP-28]GKU81216.1 hypothetical protein NCCP28_06120 [Niallia sp. NCCP-28]